MKYIGIRGHRGAGKTSIAYLLGCAIDYLITDAFDIDEYNNKYASWCKNIKSNPGILSDADHKHVIYEKFGDTPKMIISMLTGISLNDMKSGSARDNKIINLKDFSVIAKDDSFDDKLWEAEEFWLHHQQDVSVVPGVINEDIYMTLREFIIYFGIYVMQNAFGHNVWIKSLVMNSNFFNGLFPDEEQNIYKIMSDVKSRSEVSYIYDKKGIIVRVSRPSNVKRGGMNLLRGDSRYDYEIVIENDIEDLSEKILETAKNIINHESIQNKA